MRGTGRETIKAPYRDITRDPREDEDWFQRLPSAVRAWCWRRCRQVSRPAGCGGVSAAAMGFRRELDRREQAP
ncbi:MAG: hypothetical protein ACYTGW_09675 [Planctomycetota bacterium]